MAVMVSERCGKCIRTFKGNLLVCLEVNGKEFYFYMTPIGLRFISGHEKKHGKYCTSKEWDWALENWDNAKVEELTGNNLKDAKRLATLIANNFLSFMSPTETAGLPSDHSLSF